MSTKSLPFSATINILSSVVPTHLLKPQVGIVCGSGLGTLASSLRDVVHVPYSTLEGFGESTGMHICYFLRIFGSEFFLDVCSRRTSERTGFRLDRTWCRDPGCGDVGTGEFFASFVTLKT